MLGTSFFRNDVYNLSVSYPVKGSPPGRGLYIGFNLARHIEPFGLVFILDYIVPWEDYDGIAVYFHDPYDVISETTIIRHTKERSNVKFSIIPRISTIDKSIESLDAMK